MDGPGRASSKKGGLELGLEDLPGSMKRQKTRDLESITRREGTAIKPNYESTNKKHLTQILQPCTKEVNTDPCLLTLGQAQNNTTKIPDLNANTDEHNPFHPYKTLNPNPNSLDQSECSSTTGPLEDKTEENDPLKLWKEMKQNGFLSKSHQEIAAPKPRVRKALKKSEEIEKQKKAYMQKEQALQLSRFSKVTGPSGLLTGLNPGIINHVRNSKQVYSIIEAIVKDSSSGNNESFEECTDLNLSLNVGTDGTGTGKDHSGLTGLSLSEDFGSNQEAVTSLSLKAASAASQWMELLQQDIKGRLSALRRSKKRVRNAINTELPYMISTEFTCESPDEWGPHVEKWRFMFTQMDKALNDEGRYLENWLRQVEEMQSKCEKGIKFVVGIESLLLGPPNTEISKGKKMEAMEHEQVVKAAAASMYSTCNFVTKKENISCF